MDLFELLFIALFILFPVLEGVLRKRRKQGGRDQPDDGGGDVGWSEPSPELEEEPRPASDMVPDDLWEVMTGQPRPAQDQAGTEEPAPWWVEGEEAPTGSAEPGSRERAGSREPVHDEGEEPWVADDEVVAFEPASLEYEGPEAYSLEDPAPRPRERVVPSSEERHRAFHRVIDRPATKRRRRVSPLTRSLRSPDGLRQAVVLKEVLGPPKGLE